MLKPPHGCLPSKGAPGDVGGAPVRSPACPVAGSHPALPLPSREKQSFRMGWWQCLQGAPELYSVLPLPRCFMPNTGHTRRAPPSSRRSSWAARVWRSPRGACRLETTAHLDSPPGGQVRSHSTCSDHGAGLLLPQGWLRSGQAVGSGQPPSRNSAYHSGPSQFVFGQTTQPPLKQAITEELATAVFRRSGLSEHGQHFNQHTLRKVLAKLETFKNAAYCL